MFGTNIKRILNSGWTNFFRNGFVSLSSVTIMTITLSIIASVIFMGAFFNFMLSQVKDKVDVNVYFVTTATEDDINSVKKSLEALPEVSEVAYVSREDALAAFKEKRKNDQFTMQALEELGENPLEASLNIKAKETSQYEGIANFLSNPNLISNDGKNIVDKVNYNQNKLVIDRMTTVVNSAQTIALWFTVLFVLISIIIVFNTIKLSIFISKDEISVMKLVGASHGYVRGPFIVSGVLCGLISSVITIFVFIFLFLWLNKYSTDYFAGFSFLKYFAIHFIMVFFTIVGSGIVLGSAASYLAVRRYLKY
jgi:cell division transport system permease protein